MQNNHVPFYANTRDNTHCFQAALRMVLKYFAPEREFTWEKLDTITAKVKGLWTWPTAGMLWLTQNGFDVKDVEVFNYEQFVEKGKQYLFEEFGQEIADAQATHSNLEQEQELSKQFLHSVGYENRIPTLFDIDHLLSDGYLLICNINSAALSNVKGYTGHFVVVYESDDTFLHIHNPGLPAQEGQKVEKRLFESSWAYPNDRAKNILAIKRKK